MSRAKQPSDIPKLFAAYWNKRRPEGIASLFIEDADFVNVVGLWWNNRAAIFKAHDYGLRVIFKDSTLEIIKTKVRNLTDDIAVVHAKIKLMGQTPVTENSGGQRQTIFSFVVCKKEGFWYAVSAHNTDVVRNAETNIVLPNGELKSVDYRK